MSVSPLAASSLLLLMARPGSLTPSSCCRCISLVIIDVFENVSEGQHQVAHPVTDLDSHKHSTLQACAVVSQPRSTTPHLERGDHCSTTGVQLTLAVLSLHWYGHKCRFQHPLLPCAPTLRTAAAAAAIANPTLTPPSPTLTLSNTFYDTDACWQRGDSRYGTKITAKTIA
ncbi:hypothetical protein E2C01_001176 [Portunus trituberculatus]|uniref:Secreted protein n=1 Tax=Portunus trituberculatus TaxID=210409 RepID=A0A5B7CJS5_PORTR|nr:hypothetical protein [Portunus trituberculatus]